MTRLKKVLVYIFEPLGLIAMGVAAITYAAYCNLWLSIACGLGATFLLNTAQCLWWLWRYYRRRRGSEE